MIPPGFVLPHFAKRGCRNSCDEQNTFAASTAGCGLRRYGSLNQARKFLCAAALPGSTC